MILRKKNKKR